MCEFCTKHGEGKKWYLQMKNYSLELVNAQLTPAQQAAAGVATRGRWLNGFMSGFVRAGDVSGDVTRTASIRDRVPSQAGRSLRLSKCARSSTSARLYRWSTSRPYLTR